MCPVYIPSEGENRGEGDRRIVTFNSHKISLLRVLQFHLQDPVIKLLYQQDHLSGGHDDK